MLWFDFVLVHAMFSIPSDSHALIFSFIGKQARICLRGEYQVTLLVNDACSQLSNSAEGLYKTMANSSDGNAVKYALDITKVNIFLEDDKLEDIMQNYGNAMLHLPSIGDTLQTLHITFPYMTLDMHNMDTKRLTKKAFNLTVQTNVRTKNLTKKAF